MAGDSTSHDENRALDAATFEAERRMAYVRVLVMASGTIFIPLFVGDQPTWIPWLAYTLLVTGWIYSIAVLVFEPYRRFPIMLSASVTTVTDSTMTLLWVLATGGVESPWSVAICAAIMMVSLRHRPRYMIVAVLISAIGYLLIAVLLGQLAKRPLPTYVHVLYMCVTGAGAAIVSRERLSRLKSRLALLDLTQEVGQVGTWEWSLTDQTLTWSDELYRIFGVPRSLRPTFDTFMSKIHPDDRTEVQRVIEATLSAGSSFEFDHRVLSADGAVRWLHCRGRVTLGADGKPRDMVGSTQDVTGRREMEAQLLLSAKLASLGTLASGVAHEINNPLGYLANNLTILGRQIDALRDKETVSPEDLRGLRSAVEAAQHGSARVRDIVGGLKSFARAADDERSGVDLARAADLAIEIASHEITHRARLVRDYTPSSLVLANESRLSQVLVNLLVNAAHAIVRGGVADNEIRVRIYDDERGRVCVDVSDTGSGVPPGQVERIFDPFFTTKPTGMGLGLSVSHKLLRDFGGELELTRTGADGTTFRISLPAAPASALSTPPAQSVPVRSAARPRRRLLVIDDEVRYADSLRLLLGCDNDVSVATDAEHALELLSGGGSRFDVILCDLMMPGKTGMDLYEELTKIAPQLCGRMVFLTGGATSDRARLFLARPGIRHLEKPVELPALEAVIEMVTTREVSAA